MTITEQFRHDPDRDALIIVETGETRTFRDIEMDSRRLAWAFEKWGLQAGDRVAIFMENEPDFLSVLWAGLRMGLMIVPVNRYLKAEEAAFIIDDSDARAVFASSSLAAAAAQLPPLSLPEVEHFISTPEKLTGYLGLAEILVDCSDAVPPERPLGAIMTYTAGTTGRPKGVYAEISGRKYAEGLGELAEWIEPMMGFRAGQRFFIGAPLYHTAPAIIAISVQAVGGTLVMMKKFDAASALQAMSRHSTTHAYLVPTMFTRMLKLPEEERRQFDPSGLVCVLHTAEPCPPHTKQAMIDWWGPKLIDMYGASELPQGTLITSEEWLARPGSVGRPFDCKIHIVNEDGQEQPTGQPGLIYIESDSVAKMRYHKDPVKTRAIRNEQGWLTVGDIGYLDEEGYLYLTDRKDYTVISGGLNIYPRESEEMLLRHPDVLDAVAFGLPDPEMGEQLVAVVELQAGSERDPELAARLIEFCRANLTHYKCPKKVFLADKLPRLPTGKISKFKVRNAYLPKKITDHEQKGSSEKS